MLSKNVDIWLYRHFSNNLEISGSTLTGLKFSFSCFEPFLWTGVTFANLNSLGNLAVSTVLLKHLVKYSENISSFSFISLVGTSDFWVAFDGLRFLISLCIIGTDNVVRGGKLTTTSKTGGEITSCHRPIQKLVPFEIVESEESR